MPSHRRKPVSSSLIFLALHSLRSDSGLCPEGEMAYGSNTLDEAQGHGVRRFDVLW
jgi:hypothetical protein